MKLVSFGSATVVGLLCLLASRPSQAQGGFWSVGSYTYDSQIISTYPNDPANVSAGVDTSNNSAFAITKISGANASAEIHVFRSAFWNGSLGSTPTPISVKSAGTIEGIATLFGGTTATATSSVGNFLSNSVQASSTTPSPAPYNNPGSLTVTPSPAPLMLSGDFIIKANALGYEGYATVDSSSITFTF